MSSFWLLFRAGRPVESFFMSGFPLLASLLAGIADREMRWLGFAACIWCGAMAIFAFNDWAGTAADRENPRLSGLATRSGLLPRGRVLCWSLGLIAGTTVLLGVCYGPRTVVPALALYGLFALYAHPRTLWKGIPFLSTGVHLVAGLLLFALGYGWDGRADARGFFAALFLAASFAGGHLNHQVMDHDADARAGVRTTAVFLGPMRTFDLSFVVFALAYLVLFLGMIVGSVSGRLAAPFLVAAAPHTIWFLRWRRTPVERTAGHFQCRYRLAFLLAGLVAALLHLDVRLAPH